MSSCVFGSHLVLKLVHSHSGIPRVSAGQPKTQLDIQMHHPDVIRTAPKGLPEIENWKKLKKLKKMKKAKTKKKTWKQHYFQRDRGGVHLSESHVFFSFFSLRSLVSLSEPFGLHLDDALIVLSALSLLESHSFSRSLQDGRRKSWTNWQNHSFQIDDPLPIAWNWNNWKKLKNNMAFR